MEYFDVGADARFLHCVLSRVVDIRPFCENRSQRYSIYLLNVVNRVLQYGQQTQFPYWKKASERLFQDDTIHTVTLYAAVIACLDCYDFLQDDIISYNSDGGGARRVLCKRSESCYYAAVLTLQFKLQNIL